MASSTQSMIMNLSNLREIMKDGKAWRAAVLGSQKVGRDLAAEQQPVVILFLFFEELRNIFHSGCIILHSH